MCNKTSNGPNTFYIKSIYFNIYNNDKCNYYTNIPQLTIGKNDGGAQKITTGSINSTLYFNAIINIPHEAYTGLYIYTSGNALYFKNITTTAKNLFFGFNIKCSVKCTANGIFTGFEANGNIRFYVNSGKGPLNDKQSYLDSEVIQFGQKDCGNTYDITKDIIMSQIIKVPIPVDFTILFSLQFFCSSWQGTCNGFGPDTFINLNGGSLTTCRITFFNYFDS
jgi:hypothetical protein